MKRLKHKRPFAWIRWGDGEIMTAAAQTTYGQRLSQSLLFLSNHSQAIVNVGTHWLPSLAGMWNTTVPDDTLLHDFFYLPMGDRLARDARLWKSNGVLGWQIVQEQVNYTVVLVGPRHLQGLPFVHESVYIDTARIENRLPPTNAVTRLCVDIMKEYEPEPLLFVLAAGRSTKIIISDLLRQSNDKNIHTFIDVGSSLDGFAGVHSRDYNDPKEYCKVLGQSETSRSLWMKPGVCDGSVNSTSTNNGRQVVHAWW